MRTCPAMGGATILLFLVAGLVAASCGIPAQNSAEAIENPPQELFEAAPATTSTTEPEEGRFKLRLYWHTEADVLVVFTRSFSESPPIGQALRDLSLGPTIEERAQDPSTFIQPAFRPLLNPTFDGVDDDGLATIRLTDGVEFRDAANQRIAASEIVCTALQYTEVDAVQLIDSIGVIQLTDIDAVPIDGPAMAVHYDNCLPPPVATPADDGPEAEDG